MSSAHAESGRPAGRPQLRLVPDPSSAAYDAFVEDVLADGEDVLLDAFPRNGDGDVGDAAFWTHTRQAFPASPNGDGLDVVTADASVSASDEGRSALTDAVGWLGAAQGPESSRWDHPPTGDDHTDDSPWPTSFPYGDTPPEVADPDANVHESAVASIEAARFRRALRSLPAQEHQALRLGLGIGCSALSVHDVAARLGVRPEVAARLQRRGLARVRAHLDAMGGGVI